MCNSWQVAIFGSLTITAIVLLIIVGNSKSIHAFHKCLICLPLTGLFLCSGKMMFEDDRRRLHDIVPDDFQTCAWIILLFILFVVFIHIIYCKIRFYRKQ